MDSSVLRARLDELGHPVRSAANLVPASVVHQLRQEAQLLRARAGGPPAGSSSHGRGGSAVLHDDFYDYAENEEYYGRGRPDLATAKEIARSTGVSAATVRQWVHRGHLQVLGARGRAHLYSVPAARQLAGVDAPRFALPREVRVIPGLQGSDLERFVTAEQAAQLAQVASSTIRVWVTRGHLRPVRTSPRPQLFTVGDVLRVQRRTRRRGGRPRRPRPPRSAT